MSGRPQVPNRAVAIHVVAPGLTVLAMAAFVVAVLALLVGGAGPAAAQETAPGRTTQDAAEPVAPPPEPPALDAPLGEAKEVRGERGVRSYVPNPAAVLRARPSIAETDRWAIVVRPKRIELLHGARRVRVIDHQTRDAITLPKIAAKVDDPRWIEEVDDGVFLLRAALVHGAGTRLKIAGPRVRELRLADRPDVFLIGANGARAVIRDTRVVGWDERRRGVDTEYELSRPFILYTFGSRLDIRGSEIAYLGYNRGSAYGLSWREEGATGSVVDSDVHHLFFGMYSYEAVDIELRDSRWHDCVYYGIDPHDFTTGMVVEGNESYDNGSHGIIFSTGVTHGVVRDNVVHGNAGNGIVMDFKSDDALIVGNDVRDNEGDGIVILGSSKTRVEDNDISGNRVGMRVNLTSRGNVLAGNRVSDSRVGAQIYDGARTTILRDNLFRDSSDTGVVLNGARTQLHGGRITGAGVGVHVRGVATADGVAIDDVARGVEVSDVGILRARNLRIDATAAGVDAETGSLTRIYDSAIDAPEPVVGTLRAEQGNRLRVPLATLWLVLAGVGFLVIALLLHLVHQLRNRRYAHVLRAPVAPPGVTNVR